MNETIVRMGVRPQFKKPKAYLTAWLTPDYSAAAYANLERFKKEGEFKFPLGPFEMTYGIETVPADLQRHEQSIRWRAVHAALIEKMADWISDFRLAVAYAYWIARLNCRAQHIRIVEHAAGGLPTLHPTMTLQRMMGAAADCLALGWLNEAICLAQEAVWGVANRGFVDGDDDLHRRAHYFILQLIADWQGWELNGLPRCASDEPLYKDLLAAWRSDDLALVEHLLLAACDRHTHEAIPSNVNTGRESDFSDYATFYNPHEVLAVLRLRKVLGLPNPQVDHLLMSTPIGKLHDPAPFELNDELKTVLSQFRKTYPGL